MSRTLRLLMIGLAMMLGLTTVGLSAAQAETYASYGYVLDQETASAVSGVTVEVYPTWEDAHDEANLLETVTTDVDGRFDIHQPAGDYALRMVDPADAHGINYADVYLFDGPTSLGNFELYPLKGTASGTIIDHDGNPLEDGCLEIEFFRTDLPESYGAVTTAYGYSDGTYDTDLSAGSYKVRARDYCRSGDTYVWHGGLDFASASPITVTHDHNTVVPYIKISAGASITGTVEDVNGQPVGGVVVETYATDPDDFGYPIDRVYTAADGDFTFKRNQPGTYYLKISDPSHEFEDQWFDGSETFTGATPVTVTGTTDVTADPVLTAIPPSGAATVLSGKVVNVDNAPIAGITVSAGYADTITRRDGTYSFVAGMLFEGEGYTLHFEDYRGVSEGQASYLPQYYLGKDVSNDATPVTVTSTPKTLATVKLVGRGNVTGVIASPAIYDHREMSVQIYNLDNELVKSSDTKRDGTYAIHGLAPGSYRARFSGSGSSNSFGSGDFITQWFKNKSTFASATAVTVTDLRTTGSVSVTLTDQLTALVAPKISGTATKGKTLKASTGTWNRVTDTKYAYQWYRGSSAISGAKYSAYKLSSKDVGKKIRVKVTASNRYGDFGTGTSYSVYTRAVRS
jgi:hypothetical protein